MLLMKSNALSTGCRTCNKLFGIYILPRVPAEVASCHWQSVHRMEGVPLIIGLNKLSGHYVIGQTSLWQA